MSLKQRICGSLKRRAAFNGGPLRFELYEQLRPKIGWKSCMEPLPIAKLGVSPNQRRNASRLASSSGSSSSSNSSVDRWPPVSWHHF
ncbi:hypothetical protein M0804_001809 [Polistes exclamans]|nr:hypothetical protein M0804_001809 [Polistes exclamans]